MRPLTPVYDLVQEENPPEKKLRAAVDFLFEALTFREPSSKESDVYLKILKDSVADLGLKDGVILGLTPIFLDRDALFRPELAQYGKPDKYGRVMLQGHELAVAVNGAFSYLKPDAELKKALKEGRLKTRDDVRREVTRMLSDESIRKPRILQFFHEYFDYDLAGGMSVRTPRPCPKPAGDARPSQRYVWDDRQCGPAESNSSCPGRQTSPEGAPDHRPRNPRSESNDHLYFQHS